MSAPASMRGLATLLLVVALIAAAPVHARAGSTPAVTPASEQWPLDSDHFDARAVWKYGEGAGVTVGVVDSGVAPVTELRGRVDKGIDETGVSGTGATDSSTDSHGTSVAAVIAGSGAPDGSLVAGLAPQARILPVAVGNEQTASSTTVAEGISYAATHGARVVNVSLALPAAEPALRAAVRQAISRDVVVVASAGNDDSTADRFPAVLPGVVSVSGSDRSGGRWSSGNRAPGVALIAPAADVYTVGERGYERVNGTTYSAAYVSGLAALLRGRFPAETAGQIIARMTDTAQRRDDRGTGFGLIDPARALTAPVPGNRSNPLPTRPAARPAARSSSAASGPPLWWWSVGIGLGLVTIAAAVFVLRRRRRDRPTQV